MEWTEHDNFFRIRISDSIPVSLYVSRFLLTEKS